MTPSFPSPIVRSLVDPTFGPIDLSVHEAGEGPTVVFCHGFPELGFSWRHQVPAVAAAGFHAVAPDQRGYGASTSPEPIEAYGIDQLTGDLVRLLDDLGVERAVFVGHDWGGFVVWAMGALHPDRCAGIVGVCTPYVAFPGTKFLSMLVDGDVERQYMLWFQEPGVAESVIDPQARLLFEKLMVGGTDPSVVMARAFADGRLDMNPFRDLPGLDALGDPVAGPDVVDHYAEVFGRTGFRGGINWYRNVDANSERHPEIGSVPIDVPTLMICAEWDPALPPALAAGMPGLCSDLEMHTVPTAGHWVQQERPDEVNEILVDWLVRRFGPAAG